MAPGYREVHSPYNTRAFPANSLVEGPFAELALAVWVPLLDTMEST